MIKNTQKVTDERVKDKRHQDDKKKRIQMHIFHTVGYMNKLMDNNNLEQEFERSNAIVDYMW